MIHSFEATLNKVREFGLLTDHEEKEMDEFLLFIDQHHRPESEYMQFIAEFNKITGKKYIGDIESRKLYYATIAQYTLAEKVKCLTNAMTDTWLVSQENYTRLTPKYILQNDQLGKYYNYRGSGTKTAVDAKPELSDTGF